MKPQILLAIAASIVVSQVAVADNPQQNTTTKRSGQCYLIESDKVAVKSDCVIATHHGKRGSKSVNIKIDNRIYDIGSKPVSEANQPFKVDFSVNGIEADYYIRDAKTQKRSSLNQLSKTGNNGLFCYQSIVNHVCHS